MSKIKEVTIKIRLDGSMFDSKAIAEFKEKDNIQYGNYYTNGYGNFDLDKFDKDINVIEYLNHLIMSGELDLNEAESDTPRVIRVGQ